MFFCGLLILTLTLLVSVEASTNSSFYKCYYNDTSDQCASGEQCAIVPPAHSSVRRRAFYPDQDPSFFNLVGSQRRKSGGNSSLSSSSSKSSTRIKSSRSTTNLRYGTSISRASYGNSTHGITSSPAMYNSTFFWWSTPLRYYRYRSSHVDYDDDLAEYQGICVNETELRYMTWQDCYNWCMSFKYNDTKCANDCESSGSEETRFDPIWLTFLIPIGLCFCFCFITNKKFRKAMEVLSCFCW